MTKKSATSEIEKARADSGVERMDDFDGQAAYDRATNHQDRTEGVAAPSPKKTRTTRPADPELAAMAKVNRVVHELNAVFDGLDQTIAGRVGSGLDPR